MKKRIQKMASGNLLLVAFLLLLNFQCNAQEIPKDLTGNWETESTKITIRTKIRWMKYSFTPAKITLNLNIDANNSVSGTIGEAKFSNATILKNKGNPSITGIAYIIPCGLIGQICKEDTTGLKKLELWIKPTKVKGIMSAEIRLIAGWDTFPMGEAVFYLR
jgi:hypothetical protein